MAAEQTGHTQPELAGIDYTRGKKQLDITADERAADEKWVEHLRERGREWARATRKAQGLMERGQMEIEL